MLTYIERYRERNNSKARFQIWWDRSVPVSLGHPAVLSHPIPIAIWSCIPIDILHLSPSSFFPSFFSFFFIYLPLFLFLILFFLSLSYFPFLLFFLLSLFFLPSFLSFPFLLSFLAFFFFFFYLTRFTLHLLLFFSSFFFSPCMDRFWSPDPVLVPFSHKNGMRRLGCRLSHRDIKPCSKVWRCTDPEE